MRFVAVGRAHPERAQIGFPSFSLTFEGGGSIAVSCDSSQITVVVENVPNVTTYPAAFAVAAEVAQLAISTVGFGLGNGYSVELIQVTGDQGTPLVFGVQPRNDSGENLSFPENGFLHKALQLSGRDIYFRLAVRDYVRALNDVADCAVYCFRAVESIKASFGSEREHWDSMHAALGTSKEAIISGVKRYADPIRHGNWAEAKPMSNDERFGMLKQTRDLLLGYLKYKEGSLDSSEPSLPEPRADTEAPR